MSFLSTVKAIALPCATIAAKLLPEILALVPAADEAAAGQLVTTGMVDWVPDQRNKKIYAANSTAAPIVLTFTSQQQDAQGGYGVETFATQIPPRNAYDTTQALSAYGAGSTANNYLYPAPTGASAAPGLISQIVKYIPTLAATSFAMFGGGVNVSRGTANGVDFWEIRSTSILRAASFSYRNGNGTSFQFQLGLQNSPSGAAAGYTYKIPMSGPNESTGVLSEFSLTIDGDTPTILALLAKVELIPFEKLPEEVRRRLGA